MTDELNTTVAGFEVPLEGPIYDDTPDTKMTVEVKDFGYVNRTLVIRFFIDGMAYTAMAPWEKFTDGLDAMRANMFQGTWDEALAQLTGGN